LVAAGVVRRPLRRSLARDAMLDRIAPFVALAVRRRVVIPPLARLRSLDLNVYWPRTFEPYGVR
jgi:hypothetical protein